MCVSIEQQHAAYLKFDWQQLQREPEDTEATTWLYTPTAHQSLTILVQHNLWICKLWQWWYLYRYMWVRAPYHSNGHIYDLMQLDCQVVIVQCTLWCLVFSKLSVRAGANGPATMHCSTQLCLFNTFASWSVYSYSCSFSIADHVHDYNPLPYIFNCKEIMRCDYP